MNANEVIKIGRNRSREASIDASMIELPVRPELAGELHDQDRVLARQGDDQDDADLSIDIIVHTTDGHGDHRSRGGPAARRG